MAKCSNNNFRCAIDLYLDAMAAFPNQMGAEWDRLVSRYILWSINVGDTTEAEATLNSLKDFTERNIYASNIKKLKEQDSVINELYSALNRENASMFSIIIFY